MRRRKPTVPGLLPLIAVFLCAKEPVVDSGGGIDIGNPTKISVVDSADRPVANAKVKIIHADDWFTDIFSGKEPAADSAVTDISGIAVFDSIENGIYNLQIDHDSGGVFIRDILKEDSIFPVSSVTIGGYGTFSGKINSDSSIPALIRLEGSTYSAETGSDGSFLLRNVPQGVCRPLIMSADSKWTSLRSVKIVSGEILRLDDQVSFGYLAIEDFEDSLSTRRLGRFTYSTRFYAQPSGLDSASADFRIVKEENGAGNVLECALIRKGRWALIGLFLGIKPNGDSLWNFASASGLSFRARGNGKLNVSFECDTIDKMGFYKHYSADIILQPQWRLIKISFDSLKFKNDLNPNPDIGWKDATGSIKRIEFNSLESDTVIFWLDDLGVDGADLSSVYR